jgi:hypothetical protein
MDNYEELCKEIEKKYEEQESKEVRTPVRVDKSTTELLKESLVQDAQEAALQAEVDRIKGLSEDQLSKEYERQEGQSGQAEEPTEKGIPWFSEKSATKKQILKFS